jgi:hypothetical protein
MVYDEPMHNRRVRLILFAAFAIAFGAAIAHEQQILTYCLRAIRQVSAR